MKRTDQTPSRRWRDHVPLAVILALFASALFALPATAQDAPVCASADSDPDGDGWGWENNQSCTVQSTWVAPGNTCDYSDAERYGGWGWDPVNGVSCEPLDGQAAEETVEETTAAAIVTATAAASGRYELVLQDGEYQYVIDTRGKQFCRRSDPCYSRSRGCSGRSSYGVWAL